MGRVVSSLSSSSSPLLLHRALGLRWDGVSHALLHLSLWWPWGSASRIRSPRKRDWGAAPPPALRSACLAAPAAAFSSLWPRAAWTRAHACRYETQVTSAPRLSIIDLAEAPLELFYHLMLSLLQAPGFLLVCTASVLPSGRTPLFLWLLSFPHRQFPHPGFGSTILVSASQRVWNNIPERTLGGRNTLCYKLNCVPLKPLYWSPNPQFDCIWRYSLFRRLLR